MVQSALVNTLDEKLDHQLDKQLDKLVTDYLTSDDGIKDTSFNRYRHYLTLFSEVLIQAFHQKASVASLLKARSNCIDRLLNHLWTLQFPLDNQQVTLIAVGGYGRAELHPFSDVDLLILYSGKTSNFEQSIESFITVLWDTGLEIGHSVRSLKECVVQAKSDITIATNLMEARVLIGNSELFLKMQQLTNPAHIWSGKSFFTAKYQEQRQRYLKFQKTSYSLEPNIKKSPGTLRDIQMVGWVTKRHFNVDSLEQLIDSGFLTKTEFITLEKCQNFLWRVRFALHIVAGRAEDRLLFDHQRPVADMLGLNSSEHLNNVEMMMKRYYRTVKTIRELNDMLLQTFSETILSKATDHRIIILDDDFQIHGKQIEIRHHRVFIDNPSCLLKLFIHLADHPTLEGVRAPTLRRIMIDRELINNDHFRSQDENKALFIKLFRHPNGIGKPFILMKRYGVLKAYLPAYARILGQMQYDLFHIYTVDEHTVFVMDNIAKFSDIESEQTFPLCFQVIKKIAKMELLYLAALFHDIGKGQGGAHSIIGAQEALSFCQYHNLDDEDAELVSWLVKNHLLMSMTAQRKDITDPDVINQFASQMETTENLNNLYLLTVADIRATSPNLWNNWKDSLLQNLYQLTYLALDRGLENPKDATEAIDDTKNQVMALLKKTRITSSTIVKLWSRFKDDYFIRNTIERIAWQTTEITHHEKSAPLISLFRHGDTGTTEIFAYMPNHANFFTLITTLLYEKNLSIHDASLHSTYDDYILGSFVILEVDGKPISSDRRMQSIKKILSKNLRNPDKQFKHLKRRMPHRYSHFDIKTSVSFTLSNNGKRTLMELVALDKPGLLSRIGQAFRQLNIELHSAKVVTLGEKVEDIFSITNSEELPLISTEEQEQLRSLIKQLVETDHPEDIHKNITQETS